MGLTNLELYNRRHEELLREAEDRHLARRLRQEHPRRMSETKSRQPKTRLQRMTAIWGRTSVPFFRA